MYKAVNTIEELTNKGYETIIRRYYDGVNVHHQSWYLDGKHHRKDGAAFIRYDKDGSVLYKGWWLNGEQVVKEDFTSYEMVRKMKAESLFTLKELLVMKRA